MALLFDMDGVVVDSMLLHTEIEAAMFSAAGIERTPQMLTQQFAGIGLKGMIATLQAENGITLPPDFAEQVARKKEEHFQGRLQPTPHLVEALSQLADTPRCIASGAALRRVEFCLRLTDLTDFFAPHLYSSDMVARGKPAPDLFLYAAQK
ncbi:MAG: HAD family phosphatase, partial [Alphaproteobacteria bacterium]|nr:HAD family phosphatase [Alphaproteobacteria bacterium]